MSFVAAGTFACTFDILDESEMKMVFEPSNPYDPNAVLLLLNGQKIGYVPKTMNKSINPSTSQIKDWKITVNRGQISFTIETSNGPTSNAKLMPPSRWRTYHAGLKTSLLEVSNLSSNATDANDSRKDRKYCRSLLHRIQWCRNSK